MKRSIMGLIFVSALSLVLGAAVYADTNTAMQPQGWLMSSMVGESAAMVTADAQKLVGLTVDQVTNELGATRLQAADPKGGTDYFYEVQLGSGPGGSDVARLWIAVDSSNKVTNVEVST
jgi:hypothetical protein